MDSGSPPFDLNAPVPAPRTSISKRGTVSACYSNVTDGPPVTSSSSASSLSQSPAGAPIYDQLPARTAPTHLTATAPADDAKQETTSSGVVTMKSRSSPPPPDFPPPKPPRRCPDCHDFCGKDHQCPPHYCTVPSDDEDDKDAKAKNNNNNNNVYQAFGDRSSSPLRPSSTFIRDLERKIRLLDDCSESAQQAAHKEPVISKPTTTAAVAKGGRGVRSAEAAVVMQDERRRAHESPPSSSSSATDSESLDDFLMERTAAAVAAEPIYSNLHGPPVQSQAPTAQPFRRLSPPPPIPPRKQSNDWVRRNFAATVDVLREQTPSEFSFGDEDVGSDFGTFVRGDRLDQYPGYETSSSGESSSTTTTTGRAVLHSALNCSNSPEPFMASAIRLPVDANESSIAAVNERNGTYRSSPCSTMSSTSGSSGCKSSDTSHEFHSAKSDPGTQRQPILQSNTSSLINSSATGVVLSHQQPLSATRSGFLFKSGPERKVLQKRWFTLDSSALSYYKDEPVLQSGVLKPRSSPTGVLYCKNIELVYVSDVAPLAIQSPSRLQRTVSAISMKSHQEHQNLGHQLWYFEIGVHCEKEKGRQYLLAAESEADGREWIKCLTVSLVPNILHTYLCAKKVDAVGSLKLRTSVSGIPTTAWVVLAERCVFLVTDAGAVSDKHPEIPVSVKGPANVREEVVTIDLRKVVSVSMASSLKVPCNVNVVEAGQPIAIHPLKDMVFYLQSNYRVHTEAWFKLLFREWSLPMNAGLSEQYMTADNVPVAVDKCLNFVSTYGGLCEKGVYRLNGQMSTVRHIFESLRASSQIWDMHLIPEAGIHVHDVVSAFKLFLRSFPECLLTDKYLEVAMRNNDVEDRDRRLRGLKSTLCQLPLVNYCTLKRVIAHMVSVIENADKNEMFLSNLTPAVCGVLFFSSQEHLKDVSIRAQDIFADIVSNYVFLFDVTPEELEKEKQINHKLILLRETKVLSKPAGDILVGVYVNDRECGTCLNVRISPSMTAQELVQYVVRTIKTKTTAVCDLSVFEVVCDQQLQRLLHFKELVLAVTLSWATYWPADDARSNFLLVKENKKLFSHLRPILSQPPSSGGINTTSSSIMRSNAFQPFTLFSELRFSGVKWGKSFKKVIFEFVGAKLSVYKDVKATKTIGEWNIENITWFMGSEKKRNAPTDFAFTFFDRNENIDRSKDSHHFVGRVVCCNNEEEYYKWLAGMMIAEFPGGVFPPQKDMIDLLS